MCKPMRQLKVKMRSDITLKEQIAYGLSEMGTNFSLNFNSYFQLFFFTDIFRLPTFITPIFMFIFRIFDAIDDQFIAFILNRIYIKNKQYRINFLIFCVPFALFSSLMYFTPNLNATLKIFYAFSVCLIWEILYTILNTTTGALLPFITKNAYDRAKIVSTRIFFAILSIIIISIFTSPVISYFKSDPQMGYFIIASFFSIISVPMFIFASKNIKEQYFYAQKEYKIGITIKSMFYYKEIALLILIYLTFWTGCAFKDSMSIYYLTYVIDKANYLNIFIFSSISASLLMQFIIPSLISIVKKEICIIAGSFFSIISLMIMFLFKNVFPLFIFGNILYGIFSSLPANLIYILSSHYVDVVIEEMKINISAQLFATLSFAAKIGMAIATGICPIVMQISGYIPNQPQSTIVMNNISSLFFIATGSMMFISSIFSYIYFIKVKDKSIKKNLLNI